MTERRRAKGLWVRIGWGLVCLLSAGTSGGLAADSAVPLDGVVAYVDDRVITMGDVAQAMQPVVEQLRRTYQGTELNGKLESAYREAVAAMVEKQLILKAYDRMASDGKGELPERVIDRRINEMIHERFGDSRTGLWDALREEGLPYDEWRARMRDRILVSYMRSREVESKVRVNPVEVAARYDAQKSRYQKPQKVQVRVILVQGGATPQDQEVRRKLADDTLRKAQAGEDFAALARQVSEDRKAADGGLWDWVAPEGLRRELADALAALGPGQISPVVDVGGDFYLMKLEAREAGGVVPLEEVRAELERDLKKEETQRLYDAWIQRLKKESFVRIVQPEIP